MRITVTGAAGFIGSHVVRAALGAGHEVRAVVRPGADTDRLADSGLEAIACDLADDDLGAALEGAEVVVHCAWYVEPGSYLHAQGPNDAALRMSARVAREALDRDARFLSCGTCLEDIADAPASAYRTAKTALHALLAQLANDGASTLCAHVFYPYGPWEDPRRMVPTLVRSLLAGEAVATTDGRQVRDVMHVSDLAAALVRLAASDLVGSVDVCSEPIELREVLEAIGRHTGRPDLLGIGERAYGADEIVRAVGDPGPLRRLGWAPGRTLDEGIAATVAWWADRFERSNA